MKTQLQLPVQSILFVTLSNIGDAVLTTPTLAWLHQRYPDAVIDIVCDPRSVDLFVHCPYRGRLLVRDKSHGLQGWLALIQQCRQTHYDMAVDLKTDVLLPFVKAKQKFAKWSAINLSSLMARLGIATSADMPRLPIMHSVVKHAHALQPLMADGESPLHHQGRRLPNTQLWASRVAVATLQARCDWQPGRRYLVLGLGANSAHKVWPAERYAALLSRLPWSFDAVILLGDQRDQAHAAAFAQASSATIYNWCGQLSLSQTYAALTLAHFFIGNDSGLGHMAAAAGLPTFTIFGQGDPARYLPWSSKARYYFPPHQIIAAVTVEDVMTAIMKRPVVDAPVNANHRAWAQAWS